MQKINIGIIGCGHWGPNFVRNFSQLSGANVYEVTDSNIKRLEYIKELYPEIRVSQDYREMSENDKLGAVVVSTPAITHYGIVKECLRKNKHVLVEKPLALRVDEAEELGSLARRKKRLLMVGHTFLYNPAVNKIKELINEGDLGRIYYLYSTRTNLGPLRTDISAMWDLTPHDISIFSYFLDSQPYQVSAQGGIYLQKDLEDVVFVTLNYPNKIIAHIHVSWLDPSKIRTITVVGDQKMVVFNDLNNTEPIRIYGKRVMKKKYRYGYDTFEEFRMIIQEGEVAIPKVRMTEPLKNECYHFLECLRDGKQPLSNDTEGIKVVKVLNAIDKSLKSNRKIVKVEG